MNTKRRLNLHATLINVMAAALLYEHREEVRALWHRIRSLAPNALEPGANAVEDKPTHNID